MDIKQLVAQLTLEEKAGLCSGLDFWHTKPVDRLGIPSIMMTDGPHGLRKQNEQSDHLGIRKSVPATCFPAACATACSFDVDLIESLGRALGEECNAEGISLLLGPGLNIKRSPLCGRNFEYFSEDPLLSGAMATAHVKGVQSKNVAACPKHFAANNQENRRFSQDSSVDERTLREIYMSAFETVTKEAKPWTFMCAYNSVNGEFAARNHRLLTDILRDEWGFDGFVVSDWGATNDRVRCLAAGMDLEMPASGCHTDKQIVAAVNDGKLDMAILDTACERLLEVTLRTRADQAERPQNLLDAHDDLAARIAAESAVLLKNDGMLPLQTDLKVCFIGEFFECPRIQGGGSSHVNAHKITTARELLPDAPYAKGFSIDTDAPDDALEQAAIDMAKQYGACIVFAGLPDAYESEGYDREHIELPENQNRLIGKLCELGAKVAIVLHNGSPIALPFADKANAILEMYLGGQSCGRAAVELLYGQRNPCGKLAETFPLKLTDTPCHPWYNREGDDVIYHEGIFVGYRHYDARALDVRYPFGHGLSYTRFEYSDLNLSAGKAPGEMVVSFNIKNTGARPGKEIAQLYISAPKGSMPRAEKELKGFKKVSLNPGESTTVEITVDRRAFSYYQVKANAWFVEPGDYQILIGKSSRDIVLQGHAAIESTDKLKLDVSADSLLGDLMQHPQVAAMMMAMLKQSPLGAASQDTESGLGTMFQKMFQYIPLRSISMVGMSPEQLQGLVMKIKSIVDNG